jgi:hypothetical protein
MAQAVTQAVAKQLQADIDVVLDCNYLAEKEVVALCKKCTEVFSQEENVVKVPTPVTIVGDIHGRESLVSRSTFLTSVFVMIKHNMQASFMI